MPESAVPIRHAEQGDRGTFLMERDGERVAELTYRLEGNGRATLDHTYVSPVLRGEGVAMHLVEAAVDWARRSGTKLTPTCSYARAAFEREQRFADVLAD